MAAADRLIASTDRGGRPARRALRRRSGRVDTVPPGRRPRRASRPAPARRSARALGLRADDLMLLFVGRIQPLKAPDVVLRGDRRAARDRARPRPAGCSWSSSARPSGSGLADPKWLQHLAERARPRARRCSPVDPVGRAELADYYRAADLTVVPSYTESFGLVALESQACGTPVVAAAVGGLPTAVADGHSGALVGSHDPREWARGAAPAARARRPSGPSWRPGPAGTPSCSRGTAPSTGCSTRTAPRSPRGRRAVGPPAGLT